MTEGSNWSAPDDRPPGDSPGERPTPRYGEPEGAAPPPESSLPRYSEFGQPPPYGPGAPQPGVIPLRPLDLGEVYSAAIQVMRRNPEAMFGLAAIVALISVVFRYFVALGSDSARLAVAGAGGFITIVVGSVVSGALAIVISDSVLGRQTRLGEALRRVAPRAGALVGVAILYGVIVVVGFILLIVPGIYVAVALSMSTTVAVLERQDVLASFRRSRQVVSGDWWRVFGYLLLTAVLTAVIDGVLTAVFTLANVPALGSFLGTMLTAPFTAGVTVLLYVDLRIRKENLAPTLAGNAGLEDS